MNLGYSIGPVVVVLVATLVAVVTDVRSFRVYNVLTIPLLISGLVYHGVTNVQDLVDFVVARICDQLGVANSLINRWGENEEQTRVAETPARPRK